LRLELLFGLPGERDREGRERKSKVAFPALFYQSKRAFLRYFKEEGRGEDRSSKIM
jgi:hypothetical protein